MLQVDKDQYLRFNMSDTVKRILKVKNNKVYFKGPLNKTENMSFNSLEILISRGVISIING